MPRQKKTNATSLQFTWQNIYLVLYNEINIYLNNFCCDFLNDNTLFLDITKNEIKQQGYEMIINKIKMCNQTILSIFEHFTYQTL